MKISVLHNAYSFLEEALAKAIKAENEPMEWKYAILNLVQAIELSLKEKLRLEHPILIFQKIDAPKNTVNIDLALERLQKIGKINFSQSDISTIKRAKTLRNLIVHFEFELNSQESKLIFSKLLGFLTHFHLEYLDNILDEVISYELWQEAININEFSEELYSRAEKIFSKRKIDPFYIWNCANCQWPAFVIQDEINTCYVCGYKSEIITCPDCNKLFYPEDCKELQTDDEKFELFCIDCYENRICNDERYYYQIMSHFWNK